MSSLANQLADRIEEGARVLAALAQDLSEAQWRTIIPRDGRTAGVLVHHVASMYPIEMSVVQKAVEGHAITDVTWEVVAQINAAHAREHANVSKPAAVELLLLNSREAARAVRQLTPADLTRTVPFSLSFGAPMTVQFIIEDHPLRHPWHHAARIRQALGLDTAAPKATAA
jgi:DinB family protein